LSSGARSKLPAANAADESPASNPDEDDYVLTGSEDGIISGGDDEALEPRLSVMLFIPGTPLPFLDAVSCCTA